MVEPSLDVLGELRSQEHFGGISFDDGDLEGKGWLLGVEVDLLAMLLRRSHHDPHHKQTLNVVSSLGR